MSGKLNTVPQDKTGNVPHLFVHAIDGSFMLTGAFL